MANSRAIASIAGPTLMALGVTEAANIEAFAGNPASVVYLNGTVLLVAGLAIIQTHNRWTRDWTILVTLTGWFLLIGGLYRMIAPQAPQLGAGLATYSLLAALTVAGAVMTLKAYGPERRPSNLSDDRS